MSSFGSDRRNHSASFLNGGRATVLLRPRTAQPQRQHQHHSLILRCRPGSKRHLCENLGDQLADLQKGFRAMKQWAERRVRSHRAGEPTATAGGRASTPPVAAQPAPVTDARPCARNTGATVELQWLHDERELIGPCLSEVLEDVDHATEVRVHRGWNGVAGRFPLAH
jgi:hypothetical protein